MRFKVIFLVEEEILIPFTYPYRVSSWIYRILRKGDPAFTAYIHEQGLQYGGKNYKPFGFSRFEASKVRVVKTKGIIMTGSITLEIASPLPNFQRAFLDGIYEVPLKMNEHQLQPYHVAVEKLPAFHTSMTYSLSTPIVFAYQEDQQLKFGHPLQDQFYEGVIRSTINRYNAVSNFLNLPIIEMTDDAFSFEFIDINQFSIRKAAKLIKYKRKFIKGYQWPIKVEAPPDIQQFIYTCGMAQYVNQGFGFVNLYSAKR